MPSTAALTPGTLVGDDIEILSRIGGDGGLERYLARHLKHRGHVLLHVLNAVPGVDGPDMALRELEHASGVHHPGLATRHSCGRSRQDILYVAESYPPGELLAEALRPDQGHVGVTDAARRAQDLLTALALAHEAGAFHGALDPSAVLVERRELGDGRVRLLGLGVYQAARTGAAHDAPAPSPANPLYVPPELDGDRVRPGAHSDLYAIAAMTLASLAGEACLGDVRAGGALPATVADGPLGPVLRRALAVEPAARFASAHAFATAVQGVLERLTHSAALASPADHDDATPADTDIVGFGASLSSVVGTSNPGVESESVPLESATGDWLELLPKVSPSGRHSALAALEAELAFSGAAADALARHDDQEETRISGPPVPEPAADAPAEPRLEPHHQAFPEPEPGTEPPPPAAAAQPVGDDDETNPGVPGARPRSGPVAPIVVVPEPAAAAPSSGDVTQISPPPVGPPERREVTHVGRRVEPSPGDYGEDDAGVVEQRVTERRADVRTEQTQVTSRPIIGDAPPPAFRPRADGPPPGSAFEFMLEPEDEAPDEAPDEGITALRSPEPIEQVRAMTHDHLLPSTVPLEVLLAREAERDEVTSPGTPRHLVELRPPANDSEEFDIVDLRARSSDLPAVTTSEDAAREAYAARRRRERTIVAVLVAVALLAALTAAVVHLTEQPGQQDDLVEPASATPTREDSAPDAPGDEPATATQPDPAVDEVTPEPLTTEDPVDEVAPPEALATEDPVEPADAEPQPDDAAGGSEPADEPAASTAAERKRDAEKRRERYERRKRDKARSSGSDILNLKVD